MVITLLLTVSLLLQALSAEEHCAIAGAGDAKKLTLIQRSAQRFIFHELNGTTKSLDRNIDPPHFGGPEKDGLQLELCVPPALGGCEMLRSQSFMQQLRDGRSAASKMGIVMAGLLRNDARLYLGAEELGVLCFPS